VANWFKVTRKSLLIALLLCLFRYADSQNENHELLTLDKGVKAIRLITPASPSCQGSGVNSLVDGLTGSADSKDKQWMGWEGTDFEALVDLGENRKIHSLGLEVLQQPASRIFLPSLVEFFASADSRTFSKIATYNPAEVDDIRRDGPVLLARILDEVNTRYLKIKAINMGTCPAGLAGEGQKAWLFVSEIEIK